MPEITDPIQSAIDAKRSSVDELRAQIAQERKAQAVGGKVGDAVVQLQRLEAEEARLREELAAIQAGAVAERVVPEEAVSESAVPEGVPTEQSVGDATAVQADPAPSDAATTEPVTQEPESTTEPEAQADGESTTDASPFRRFGRN